MLKPPTIRPNVPPADAPSKWRNTWRSLLGKPTTLEEAGITSLDTRKPLNGPLAINSKGKPDLKLQRLETSAAVLPVIEIIRNGVTLGFVGIDASDNIAVLAANGTTVLLSVVRSGGSQGEADALLRFKAPHLEGTTDAKAPAYLDGAGTQVVGAQQAAIANGTATSGSPPGTNSTGGTPTDPATLGDVDGVYGVTNGLEASVADALGTANTALATANAALGAMRTHGLIHP